MSIEVGQILRSKKSGYARVLELKPKGKILIEFLETGYITEGYRSNIQRGTFYDPLYPCIYGIGYFGLGPYKAVVNKSMTKEYQTWRDMIRRCYSSEKRRGSDSYGDKFVCENWHNFQNFAGWVTQQYGFDMRDENGTSWAIDKDILIMGNREYSPDSCRFITAKVNSLFTDSRSKRGEWPLGVDLRGGRFRSRCSDGGKISIHLGDHKTPQEAHAAWQRQKIKTILQVAENDASCQTQPEVLNALLLRAEKLQIDLSNSVETLVL